MKVSVSLPSADVQFLDEYARKEGIDSRSAAIHQAVRLLRNMALSEAYEAAMNEWTGSEDESLWESTAGDGLHA